MKPPKTITRCAIYTRVSTDQGLDQDFNSLDAQREASEAYIKSQAHEGWIGLKQVYDDGGYSGGSMDRPALQILLEDVRARKLDVIVVYKVDRLTRSLADFAKLVELFDSHGVSFVSVTQSFNTTSSMGRLTLNVLLSFAQFEREVTGERIRDKIAASKKKGMWMGGVVPHGYRVENRKLLIDEQEAAEVRLIFELYHQLKSTPKLVEELERRGIRSRLRKLTSGKEVGGISFMTGPLAYMLGNRAYLGEINHQDNSYTGEHQAIISSELFEAVQKIKADGLNGTRNRTTKSSAILAGRIFDDRGNHMTPVHVTKGSVRYRYYQSWVLAHGQKHKAGSVSRVPADDIEQAICAAMRPHVEAPITELADCLRQHVKRVDVHQTQLVLILNIPGTDEPKIVVVPWTKPPRVKRRKIYSVENGVLAQPIRSKARTRLLTGMAQGRLWLDHLTNGRVAQISQLAAQHGVSEKTIRSTITLCFLAPDIVQAAIEGRLPRGMGISQMTDLPPSWDQQRQQLGLI